MSACEVCKVAGTHILNAQLIAPTVERLGATARSLDALSKIALLASECADDDGHVVSLNGPCFHMHAPYMAHVGQWRRTFTPVAFSTLGSANMSPRTFI